jgi:hypothetical protein
VNFQSFNAYDAGVLKVTTYSFQLNLATYPLCRAPVETQREADELRPAEYECDFRRMLCTTIAQPETDHATMWYVRPDGSNLKEIIGEAKAVLLREGLEWFDQLAGLDALLRTARDAPQDMSGGVWGMGNSGSPHRRDLVAALEAAVATRGAV